MKKETLNKLMSASMDDIFNEMSGLLPEERISIMEHLVKNRPESMKYQPENPESNMRAVRLIDSFLSNTAQEAAFDDDHARIAYLKIFDDPEAVKISTDTVNNDNLLITMFRISLSNMATVGIIRTM